MGSADPQESLCLGIGDSLNCRPVVAAMPDLMPNQRFLAHPPAIGDSVARLARLASVLGCRHQCVKDLADVWTCRSFDRPGCHGLGLRGGRLIFLGVTREPFSQRHAMDSQAVGRGGELSLALLECLAENRGLHQVEQPLIQVARFRQLRARLSGPLLQQLLDLASQIGRRPVSGFDR